MTLEERVIDLHNIAREIEQEMGRGKLSEDLRSCADRLHQLVKKHYYLQDRKEIKSELGYSRVGANNT